jgi:mRNA-degrading endonuclease YafQ of YafQ-DinJ toxin-antitoxin module
VSYSFKTTKNFRKSFRDLTKEQRKAAKDAFKIFKQNPFDPRLKPHKIQKLSARFRVTIHSVTIEGDLRAVFYVDGSIVYSVDIGCHKIYR